jgi:hypothetical protein
MPVFRLQYLPVLKDAQDRHLHPVFDPGDLEEAGPDGEHTAHQQKEDQHIRPPYEIVQDAVDLFNGLQKISLRFMIL